MSGPGDVSYNEDWVIADSTDYVLRYLTRPLVAYGGTHLDLTVDVQNLGAQGRAKLAFVPYPVLLSRPGAVGTLGTAISSEDFTKEAFSLSGTTALYVRGALYTALNSGTTPEEMFTRLWGSVRGAGWIAARQMLILTPESSDMVLPIGGPFPGAGVDGLMFGLNFRGVNGTIVAPTTVYRTFDSGDLHFPNTWQTVAAESNVTADGQVNSSGSITTTGNQMVQAGLRWSTSGSNPNAIVDVTVAAKS
jgi:hypothetical protein